MLLALNWLHCHPHPNPVGKALGALRLVSGAVKVYGSSAGKPWTRGPRGWGHLAR